MELHSALYITKNDFLLQVPSFIKSAHICPQVRNEGSPPEWSLFSTDQVPHTGLLSHVHPETHVHELLTRGS